MLHVSNFRPLKRVDIAALCTNRDLAILDDILDQPPVQRLGG